MATKTKSKPKAKAKPAVKKATTPARKAPAVKAKSTPVVKAKPKSIVLSGSRTASSNTASTSTAKPKTTVTKVKVKVSAVRSSSGSEPRVKGHSKGLRIPQYNYMKPPGVSHDFQVGDTVEVFCDHEKNRDRVRGWIRGIVVQVDNKLVAVQFRSNVYLTDGWMVPDRILWYPLISEHMRPVPGKRAIKREDSLLPDY